MLPDFPPCRARMHPLQNYLLRREVIERVGRGEQCYALEQHVRLEMAASALNAGKSVAWVRTPSRRRSCVDDIWRGGGDRRSAWRPMTRRRARKRSRGWKRSRRKKRRRGSHSLRWCTQMVRGMQATRGHCQSTSVRQRDVERSAIDCCFAARGDDAYDKTPEGSQHIALQVSVFSRRRQHTKLP